MYHLCDKLIHLTAFFFYNSVLLYMYIKANSSGHIITRLASVLNTIRHTVSTCIIVVVVCVYSETSEQRTHWGQDSCPL